MSSVFLRIPCVLANKRAPTRMYASHIDVWLSRVCSHTQLLLMHVQVDGGAGAGSLLSVTTGRCVTAGWPFFTGAAFEMNEESRDRYGKDYAVVVLNEAEEAVEFDLTFPSEEFTVSVVVGARSIQTILA